MSRGWRSSEFTPVHSLYVGSKERTLRDILVGSMCMSGTGGTLLSDMVFHNLSL